MALTMSIDFAANIARLEENTRKAAGSVRQMSDQIDSAVGFARNALASLGVAIGVNAFVSQVRAASEAADAAAKMGDRFSIATQSAVGMSVAVEMAGGSQEGLVSALRKTTSSVAEAAMKAGETRTAFTQLGLSATELSRLPVDQQFERIVDSLGKVENATLRNALGNQVLGKSYGEVAGLVAEGSDAIRQATEDATAWGLALSRVDAAKVEAANDAMTRVQNAARGLFTTISVALAPAIKMVADYFADSAKAANGYKEEVVSGSEWVAQAIAYSANAVHFLQQAWAGVKLAVGLALDFVIQSVASMDQVYTDFMNKFADSWVGKKLGMEKREYSAFLTEMSEISATRVEELKQEAFAMVEAGWPAEKILAKYREVQAQMQAEAEATARNRQGTGGEVAVIKDDDAAKRELAWQQGVAARLAKLQEANMTEAEIERGKLTVIQNDLQFALDMRFITEQQYHDLLQQEQLKHEAKLGNVMAQGALARQKFVQMSAMQQTQTVLGEMVRMTQGVATHSRAMFEINKVAGVASAIINTYEGVTLALAKYPGPIGIAMAGITLAAGLAQVDAISSAQFGSSTSAPTIAGGGATPITNADPGGASALPLAAVPELAKAKAQVNVTLVGSQFSYDQVVNEILPLINEASDNGADIRITTA